MIRMVVGLVIAVAVLASSAEASPISSYATLSVRKDQKALLEAYLKQIGITNATSKEAFGSVTLSGSPDDVKYPDVSGMTRAQALEVEILWRMIVHLGGPEHQQREHYFDSVAELKKKVQSLINTVENALAANHIIVGKYGRPFNGAPTVTVPGWTGSGNIDPTLSTADALERWFAPPLVAAGPVMSGCAQGTRIVILRGISQARGKDDFDSRIGPSTISQGSRWTREIWKIYVAERRTANPYDWLPGEWGHIEATNVGGTGGGENIIYIGGSFQTKPRSGFLHRSLFWGLWTKTGGRDRLRSIFSWLGHFRRCYQNRPEVRVFMHNWRRTPRSFLDPKKEDAPGD